MKMIMIPIALIIVLFFSVAVQAQIFSLTTIVPGTVKEIKSNALKLQKDSGQGWIMVRVNPETVYDNVQQLSEISIGDKVQVKMRVGHGQPTAISVKKMESGQP